MDIIDFFKEIKQDNPVDVSNWKPFVIADIFDVGTGASIKKSDLIAGEIPRITVTTSDNGILGRYAYIDSPNYRLFENFVSYSFLGTCFYHLYKASVDMKVHTLQPKGLELNPCIGLFLVAVLRKSYNPDYNNQISKDILKGQKIYLPAITDSLPNWELMESYIRQLPLSNRIESRTT